MKSSGNKARVAAAAALAIMSVLAWPWAGAAAAEAFDTSRPIRLIVPLTPGGSADALARIVAEEMRTVIPGASVVVENRPGALGAIGTSFVAKSAPDGHTLVLSLGATFSANPALVKNLSYDPLKDFTHVVRMASNGFVLVAGPAASATTLQALVDEGRANPKKLAFGYGTSTIFVTASTFARAGKFEALPVSYQAQPPALTDLLGGQTHFMFADIGLLTPYIKTGKVKALAVSSLRRATALPDLPTLDEQGFKGFDLGTWVGLSAPAGTPPDTVAQLNAGGQQDHHARRHQAEGRSAGVRRGPHLARAVHRLRVVADRGLDPGDPRVGRRAAMTDRLLLKPGGARVRGLHYPYERERSIKWSDNVPEHGGNYAMLTLETTGGLTGVSEATLKPIWTGASIRSITAALEDVLLPRLAGIDLADAAAVGAALAPVPENMPGKMLVGNACWDLRARSLGVPLWQLLGGQQHVALSWTLTRAAPEVMIDEALAVVARHGFRTIKMKGGQGIDTDAKAVRGILDALGRNSSAASSGAFTLYVDANWQYPPAEGLAFAKAIVAEGAALVEDPWPLQPDDTFRRSHQALPVPILVDNFCSGSRDMPVWLDHGARAFSVKPGRIGISDALAMSRLCGERGARVVVGMFAETQVGSLHTLSFASAQHGDFAAESSFFLMFRDSPLKAPLVVQGGTVCLPAVPGFAPLVDWDVVDKHTLPA